MAVVEVGVVPIAAVASALVAALAPHLAGGRAGVTMFGGYAAIRVQHVGRIEVDLEAAGSSDLRRVACVGGRATTSCFVAATGVGR